MLTITVKAQELYDEVNNRFTTIEDTTLELEHSLYAISKWESKWKTPFLQNKEHSKQEVLSYIECMCMTPDIPHETFFGLTSSQVKEITDYINDPMSATTINNRQQGGNHTGEVVSSELIYYWMNEGGISMECEHWHLNRLMKLIEVTSIKRQPPKKMSRHEAMSRQSALNKARRARTGSRG